MAARSDKETGIITIDRKVEEKVEKAVEVAAEEAKEVPAKKTVRKPRAKKAPAKTEKIAEKAEKAVEPVKKAARKPRAAKAAKKPAGEVIIQSQLGGEITPEAILAKVGEVDKVYVRVDENKAYWVKGDETGAVDLW